MGFSAEEAIGRNVEELKIIDTETRKKIREEFISKGKIRLQESNISTKSGEKKSILTSAEAITIGDNKFSINLVIDITGRKQGEDALRESEEKFKAVFESANVGKSITLPTGEINVNQTFCDMLGYTHEELQNKKWQDITPQDEIPDVQKTLAPLLNGTKDSARFEKRYICKDGSYKWTDVSTSVKRDENGKPLHFITTVIDITERKLAEVALRKSEELYRSLFMNMLNGFAYCQMLFEDGKPIDYIYLAVNNAFVAQTGLKDVVGRKVTEIIPGIREADPQLFEVLGRVSMTGQPEQFEIFLEALQNWFMLSLYSPAHEHFVAVFDVITERKNVELALQESEERYRTIISNIPGGLIHIFDRNMKYVFNAGEELARLGLSNEFLVGKSIHEVLPADVVTMVEGQYKRVLAGETIRFEGGYGNDYFSLTSAPLRNVKGEIANILTLSVNITERKRAEEALHKSEQLLSFSLEKSHTGGWDLDLVDHTAHRTLTHDQIFGYDALLPQWTYEMFLEHVLEEDRADVNRSFGEATANQTDWSFECRIRRKDGEVRWIWAAGGHQHDTDGQARRMAGIVQDITERKKLEIERQKFFMLAESSSEFIGMCDLELNPLYVNPAGRRMVGLPDMEAACRVNVQDYYFPEDQQFIAEDFFPRVLREGNGAVEIRLRHFQTGEAIWVYYYLFRIQDDTGKPIGWATVSRDITERRKTEEDMRQQLDELQRWHTLTIGRESRVSEIKREVNELLIRMGEPIRYPSQVSESDNQETGESR